ncbi:MAG TPA: hypothetical protein VJ728_10110, partial [Candidatus Binataceae bacterium]|nr:hypothetical protein [Candidatus Binataceae bacterium]
MRRFIQLFFAFWFAISMTFAQACLSLADPSSTYSGATGDDGGTYSGSSGSRSTATGYSPEREESQALTEYLKQRKLPLVGAQVLRDADGHRRVVLYGFVGSDFGKSDAATKARRFLHDSAAEVDNRINVRPELLASNRPSNAAPANPNSEYPSTVPNANPEQYPDSSSPDASKYPGPDSYKAQQASPYPQGLTSMVPLIALLGVLGMGLAGGSSGFSFGSSPFGSSQF